MKIRLKRAYDAPSPVDGVRVLVERLWPRGLSRERAALDHWFKGLAPSPELRRWYGHDTEKWPEFRRRYREELRSRPEDVERLRRLARRGPVTFVYATRDEAHRSATVLREFVETEEAEGRRAA